MWILNHISQQFDQNFGCLLLHLKRKLQTLQEQAVRTIVSQYLWGVLVKEIDHGGVDVWHGDALPVGERVRTHPHDVVAALLGHHGAVARVDHDQGGDAADLVNTRKRPNEEIVNKWRKTSVNLCTDCCMVDPKSTAGQLP